MCTKAVDILREARRRRKMRITQEADYAIRICTLLDSCGGRLGAAEISRVSCITQRIALKVMRKLCGANILRSYQGVGGGYELSRAGESISIIEIIEAVDGAVRISRCLECDRECTKNPCKGNCKMHIAFGAINKRLVEDLGRVNIRMLSDESVSGRDIVEKINNK